MGAVWNIRLNQPLVQDDIRKKNWNLQCRSSFANGCLRWLYPASRKTQVLQFFRLLHNPHNVWENISIFLSAPLQLRIQKKKSKVYLPPCTIQVTPMDTTSRGTFLHSVRCISEKSDIQGEKRRLCEQFLSITQV